MTTLIYRPIEVGDKVQISFVGHDAIVVGKVLHVPGATGDAWHISNSHGKVVYVQNYEVLARMDKK